MTIKGWKDKLAPLSTQQGIRRPHHLHSLVLLCQTPPPLLGGSWRHGEVDTSLITRNQDNSLEEQKQMKEENELKGSKKLKCFQRMIFNQKKKKKKTHRPPHYVVVVHNLTQNARLHVLLLLNSNIFSYLIMESYTQWHNRRQKNRSFFRCTVYGN